MDTFVVLINIAVVIVTSFLATISVRIIRVTREKGIKKTVYKPVVIAGFVFIIGSLFIIVYEFLPMSIFEIMHHLSWLVALIIITYGSYDYMKMLEKAG
jgi:Na+-transporting NADH:ubiquinone oxidoreductase subunit NqrD